MEVQQWSKEITIHRVESGFANKYFTDLQLQIDSNNTLYATRYACIADLVIRFLVYDRHLDSYISRELSFVLSNKAPHFDYTIVVWLAKACKSEMKEDRIIEGTASSTSMPICSIDRKSGRIIGYNENDKCFYYGFTSKVPEELSIEGHIFFKQFYRMFKPMRDISLVHGACVGINGAGVLLCAMGNRGKSTLTVLSLLKGFEYVSDDYLIIEKREKRLFASPIYSIVTLSPQMYDEMYDELEGTRFISNNWNKSKYILNISNLHDRFRVKYPIKVCLFPEIVSDSEPSIIPCSKEGKGKAITNMVYSTITQMGDSSDTANTVKLMSLLKDQVFFKINLCRDIHKNVECLRDFLLSFKL